MKLLPFGRSAIFVTTGMSLSAQYSCIQANLQASPFSVCQVPVIVNQSLG